MIVPAASNNASPAPPLATWLQQAHVGLMFGLDPLPDAALRGLVLALAALFWVVALVRVMGARTLSKMSAFDFVVTLATGSLLATAAAASSLTAFVQAIIALTTLLAGQYLLALARQRSDIFRHAVENDPLLLMRDGDFIDSALRTSRVSRSDVLAKLRQADVDDPASVAAVILETTGDVSILTGDLSAARTPEVRGI